MKTSAPTLEYGIAKNFRTWRLAYRSLFGLLHLVSCISLDRGVSRILICYANPNGVNPFGINLLPYVPASAVFSVATSGGMSAAFSRGLAVVGMVLVLGAAFLSGSVTQMFVEQTLGSGRHRRITRRLSTYMFLVTWFGWIVVPVRYSLYFYWLRLSLIGDFWEALARPRLAG